MNSPTKALTLDVQATVLETVKRRSLRFAGRRR